MQDEPVNIEKLFVKKGKGLAMGVSQKRVHIIEPSGRGTPVLSKKHAEEIVSPTGTNGKSSIPLSLPSAFSLPPFASSSPKHTWFGNVFNLQPPTFSLISMHDIQTTRTECNQLLVSMKVRIVSEDPHGLGGFKCKIDEVKEPSGVMNMSNTMHCIQGLGNRKSISMWLVMRRDETELNKTLILHFHSIRVGGRALNDGLRVNGCLIITGFILYKLIDYIYSSTQYI